MYLYKYNNLVKLVFGLYGICALCVMTGYSQVLYEQPYKALYKENPPKIIYSWEMKFVGEREFYFAGDLYLKPVQIRNLTFEKIDYIFYLFLARRKVEYKNSVPWAPDIGNQCHISVTNNGMAVDMQALDARINNQGILEGNPLLSPSQDTRHDVYYYS